MQPPSEKQKLGAKIRELRAKGQPTRDLERQLAVLQAREGGPAFASAPPSPQPASSARSEGTRQVTVTTAPPGVDDEALFEMVRKHR